jgi:hypothetical protein
MKKIFLLIVASFVLITTLSAQVSQEEADIIVLKRMQSELKFFTLHAMQDIQLEGKTLTTSKGELFELGYAAWLYYVNYVGETNGKYLFVKANNGNLLEINTTLDELPNNLIEWRLVSNIIDIIKGEWSWIKTIGGIGGFTFDNEFKSIVRFLSQNEDSSINYEVVVEDTLFSHGSFQLFPHTYSEWYYNIPDIELPHETWMNWDWVLILTEIPGNNTLLFGDGAIDGYYYYYEKLNKK